MQGYTWLHPCHGQSCLSYMFSHVHLLGSWIGCDISNLSFLRHELKQEEKWLPFQLRTMPNALLDPLACLPDPTPPLPKWMASSTSSSRGKLARLRLPGQSGLGSQAWRSCVFPWMSFSAWPQPGQSSHAIRARGSPMNCWMDLYSSLIFVALPGRFCCVLMKMFKHSDARSGRDRATQASKLRSLVTTTWERKRRRMWKDWFLYWRKWKQTSEPHRSRFRIPLISIGRLF